MQVLPIRSGVVDSVIEGILILLGIVLVAPTLDRIRGLSLETKLRRGEVVDLRRRSLTLSETAASVVVVVGLPVAALVTSLGRNGESDDIFEKRSALVDVWDVDASGSRFPFGKFKSSVLLCGTTTGASPQSATVNGKTFCPGDFKSEVEGFIKTADEENLVRPPPILYPTTEKRKVSGDWNSQCVSGQNSSDCYTWLWTTKKFSLCSKHSRTKIPTKCQLYDLMPGAPKIDHSKSLPKVVRGSADGGDLTIMMAHYTVTTLKKMDVEVVTGQRQVTIIETWSTVGLVVVVVISLAAALAAWIGTVWTAKKRGYELRLHTYSGLAAYAASLEDRNSVGALDASRSGNRRPVIRLTEGAGEFAGHISIGHDPGVRGFPVRAGRIGIGRSGVDDFPENFDGSAPF